MQARIQSIEVDSHFIEPALSIVAEVPYYYLLEAPFSLSGNLRTEDGKTIALLQEVNFNTETTLGLKIFSAKKRNEIYHSGGRHIRYQSIKLMAPLSQVGISHIEGIREKNGEQQVKFHFQFLYKYVAIPAGPDTFLDQEQHEPFWKVEVKTLYTEFIIKQSDWVRHYSLLLGIGNFLLLELRQPDTFTPPEPWRSLYERIMTRLQEMKESMRHGDWQKVMYQGRQFYENLKMSENKPSEREWKQFISGLMEKDGHNEDSIDAFYKGIFQLFTFSSKFIHDKDTKGQLNTGPQATREEAELLYGLGVLLVNVLGKKISRS